MKIKFLQGSIINKLLSALILLLLSFANLSYAKGPLGFDINIDVHNQPSVNTQDCDLSDLQGSYRESCSNCRLHRERLRCDCRQRNGAVQHTLLRNNACGCSNIVNENGRLRCYAHRGWRRHSRAHRQCITDTFGKQACGYGCIKTMNSVRCAPEPGQSCVANAFGDTACGYNCVKQMNKIICAQRRRDTCVINAFGDARCGRDCHVDDFNNIACS